MCQRKFVNMEPYMFWSTPFDEIFMYNIKEWKINCAAIEWKYSFYLRKATEQTFWYNLKLYFDMNKRYFTVNLLTFIFVKAHKQCHWRLNNCKKIFNCKIKVLYTHNLTSIFLINFVNNEWYFRFRRIIHKKSQLITVTCEKMNHFGC